MGLKQYTLRLDEEVYEGLKKEFEGLGDPDLNISFVIRTYLRDLYESIPDLKKSEFGLRSNLAFWGMAFKQLARTAQLENLFADQPILQRAQKEIDKKPESKKRKK